MFKKLWKRLFTQSPKTPESAQIQSFILEPILTPSGLIDAGDDLPDPTPVELPEVLSGFNTGEETPTFESGYFTVGDSGEVEIDFLFDGGKYKFELGIFSLEGLDAEPGSEEFIEEAARRSLSDSELGHVVLFDQSEGAKFEGDLGEAKNWNKGDYQGLKTVQMRSGEQFGIMLVPNGTVEDVYENPSVGGAKQPLFSLSTANPDDTLHLGQIADVTGDGNTFVMEDVRFDHNWYDQDYNDLIFQVRGATGKAELLDNLMEGESDWRDTDLGQAIIDYTDGYVGDDPIPNIPDSPPDIPQENQPLIGMISTGVSENNPDIEPDRLILGQDYIDGDDNPLLAEGEGNEAGTHQLGIIAATQDNEIGIDGITEDTPIWVSRSDGETWVNSLQDFIETAKTSESPNAVVNMGFPIGDGLTTEMQDTLNTAREEGVLIVIPDSGQSWPDTYDNVIVVGSTGDDVSGGDILAEGGSEDNPVVSTVGEDMGTSSGTSVAASQVTGMVSQVWGANPGLSSQQIVEIIQQTATEVDGEGVINVDAAIHLAQATEPDFTDLLPIVEIDDAGEPLVVEDVRRPNFLPDELRLISDRFYNPTESVSVVGKVQDLDGIEDLQQIDFWLQKDGGDWVNVGETDNFTFDPYTENAFRFNRDFGQLEPGNYRLQTVPYDSANTAWETKTEEFTVLSVPEGEELSDRVKASIERSLDLESYDPVALSQTTEWLVSVQAGQNVEEFAQQLGAVNVGATGQIANTYRWKFPLNKSPQEVAKLLNIKGIEFAYPLVPLQINWHSPSDEPYVQNETQWHLNSGNTYDSNVFNVWEDGTVGNGSVIGFVDNGFDIEDPGRFEGHPDLMANYRPDLSWDFVEQDAIASRGMGEVIIRLENMPKAILEWQTQNIGGEQLEVGFDWGAYNKPDVPKGHNYYGFNSDVDTTIDRLFVNLDLDHQELQDIEVRLVSPEGIQNEDAGVPIPLDETGNFAGYISDFEGESSSEKWILKVIDKNPDDGITGRLNEVVLKVNEIERGHGTKVAGVAIASGDNNRWGTGVAPEANWAALRMGDQMDGRDVANILYDAFGDRNDEIDIYNNSWGFNFYQTLTNDSYQNYTSLMEAAIEKGAKQGRDDLGNIYIFSAGNGAENGSDVNYNLLANTRQSIAVAAIDANGKHSSYSESGTPVFVSAYSNAGTVDSSDRPIVTTGQYSNDGDDSNDYTISAYQDGDNQKDNLNDFGGTSAAAPFVSGVVALMLEANPDLTWRDVQHILVETAQKNDPNDSEWMENKAGYWVNPKYGFGAVDAAAAVEMAKTWTSEVEAIPVSGDMVVSAPIPDADANQPLKSTITLNPMDEMNVEWVEVGFNGKQSYLGDLKLVLTSPEGSKSVLSQQHLSDPANEVYNSDQDNFNWTFTSAHHWGEAATGEWTLEVIDELDGNTRTAHWTDWNINVYGTKPNTPPEIDDLNPNQTYTEDTPLTLTPITITDADGDNITVVLTLSDPNVGSLVTGTETSNSEGLLTLTGTPEEVTQKLGNLQFNPAPNYNGDFEITTSVTDGNLATPLLDKIHITGLAVNDAPTLTDVHLTGATEVQPFEISYEDLLAASGASDVEGDAISLILDTVENGTLTKDGVPVIPGETTINPGDTVVWTPDNAGDAVTAFNLSATDGEDVSDAVAVTVEVAAQPTVTINPIWLNASEDGYPAFLNITRQNGNLAEDLTVNLDISGTATPGLDYQTLPSTVTIPAGSTSVPLVIYPVDDTQYEGTETVVIGLGEGDYLGNTNLSHTVTITDNDPNLPEVTLRATDAEASEDGNAAQFVVERTGDTSEALTVEYSLAGEAVNGEDYLPLTNTVTIPAGATTATIPVVPYHDYDSETQETVVINLTNAATYAVGTDNSATATIENSTRTSRYGPFVYVNPDTGNQYILSEKDTWLGAQEQAGALGGNLVTINDQAENDWLYETFGRGRQWIGLNDSEIYGNTEGNHRWVNGEELTFTPSIFRTDNVQNTSDGEDFFETNFQGIGNWNDMPSDLEILGEPWTNPLGIIEIDPTTLEQPIVNFMVTDDEAGEDGNAGQVVVTRVGDLDEDLTINYSLSGDAENGVDYQGLSETVVIPAGQSLATIPIIPVEDNLVESQETVVLNLESGNYDIGTHGTGQVTLSDNDEMVANSLSEFSGIQGQDNWYYGYYDGDLTSNNFNLMTEYKDENWWVDQDTSWAHLEKIGGHPSGGLGGQTTDAQMPTRRWISEVDGQVTISGNLAKDNTTLTTIQDGITGRILVDGVEVWSQAIEATDGVGVDYSITTEVTQGSVIDFVIDSNENHMSDGTLFNAKITTQQGEVEPVIYTNPETGNKYFVTANDTWLGAQEQAEAAGGNLVTINSESENQWLFNTFGGTMRWIGYNDSPIYGANEGEYQWVSGDPSTYSNWFSSAPNNVQFTPEGEDFAHTHFRVPDGSGGFTEFGKWNDLTADHWSLAGIVEIPNEAGYNWTWTYFGEDLHTQGNDIRLDSTPNTDAAKADFLANLNNVETVNFENFNHGDKPTVLDFGSTQVTLSGHSVVREVTTATSGGMFPSSGDNLLQSSDDTYLTLEFDSPQSAFGFTATDSEGFPLVLTVHHEDGTTSNLDIPAKAVWPENSGSAFFYGITDIHSPFTKLTLIRQAGTERIGLDDLVIGDIKPDVLGNTSTPPNETLHLAYHEDTPLNLSDILVTDPDGEATVKLTLSDPNAGQLTTATSGNVTSTYDAATGVWTATGAVSDLNTLLANLEFNPTANSSSNLEIASEITVGTGTPLTGTITLTGLPENDDPTLQVEPTQQWVRQLGSSGYDSGRDIAVDGTNNAFVVGSYNLEDGFIAKYDEAGNPLWTQQLNSPDTDELYGVTTDSLGDVYAVGSTHGSIEGHPNLGGKDAILVKYDGSGNLIWSKQFGTTAHDQLHKIISDNAGHFYSVGYTDGVMDGETDQGGANALLIKWDNEGNAIWTKQLKSETNASTIGWDLAYDEATGHVYITGYGPGSLDGETNAGSNDAFIAKYDSEGNLDWNRQLGTPEHDEAYAIALDADGNPYISGWTQGSLEGHTLDGEYDGFVAKYDPQGHLLWTEQYGTEGKDINNGINIDEHGQVTVTGYVGNSLDANPYNGGIDAALTGFDTNGNRSWSQQFGFGGSDYLKQVVSGNDGSFYTTGGINGQLESQTHAGSIDPFVAKYNHTQTYQQNTPLDLNGIYVNDADLWDELTITLSLSDANAGTLTSNISNNATTTFENGVLTVTGSANEVNAVLEDLQFNPATGYTETVTINTAVTDGTSDPVTGATITLEGNAKPTLVVEPTRQWLRSLEAPHRSSGLEIAIDSQDNTYMVGKTYGDLHDQTHSGGATDGLITKHDSEGNRVWTRLMADADMDALIGITVDPDDNLAVVGLTRTEADEMTSNGVYAKYDPDGNLLWTREYDSGLFENFHRVVADDEGNFYAGGFTRDEQSNAAVSRGLIVKFDTEGNVVWTKPEDLHNTVTWAMDYSSKTGHVYTAGTNSHTAFISEYDRDGNLIWQDYIRTDDGKEEVYDISVDSQGNIHVVGRTSGTFEGNTSSGDRDVFVAKYNRQGDRLWVQQFGTEGHDIGQGISVDAYGNVFVSGQLEESPGAGSWEGSVTIFDANGNRIPWTDELTGPGWDSLTQMDWDSKDNLYVVGENPSVHGGHNPLILKYNHTQTYQQNTPLDLNGIYINDTEGDTVTVTLTLSDANAGTLTSTTTNDVSTEFSNGVLTVTGSANEVNAVLEDLQFNPATGYTETVTINTAVTDGTSDPVTGATLTLESTKPPEFFAPDTPYLSFEDSPFKDETFTEFNLETFEDGQLNTPGLTISTGFQIDSSSNPTSVDSVDGDDGTIDGSGLGGSSWYVFGAHNFTVNFDQETLGQLPTHAGFALTDIGRSDTTNLGSGRVIFEAFDANGQSLGMRTIDYGDNIHSGQTAEDRFLGVVYEQGISTLKISLPDGNRGGEIDHIQYGFKS